MLDQDLLYESTIHDAADDDLTNFPAHTHSASQGPPTAKAPENHYDGKHSCNDPGKKHHQR